MEPAYSFTIPSVEDDTVLDCRVYQPTSVESGYGEQVKGAVIAHPYASLGGSQDDGVVLSITEHLLSRGYIIVTFNFRGAGESHGRTSWTGKGEKDDYVSVIGFLTYYLRSLGDHDHGGQHDQGSVSLLLAGYSYGSLILSHLPPVSTILHSFDTAAIGTSAAEIILRAQRLAGDTTNNWHRTEPPMTTRGRHKPSSNDHSPSASHGHTKGLTVTLGGEETDPSERRTSRDSKDSRRGFDAVKRSIDMPHRIKVHIRRSSSKSQDTRTGIVSPTIAGSRELPRLTAEVRVRYLLISPLLPPLAHALVPPHSIGTLFGRRDEVKTSETGFGSHSWQSLAIWGTNDTFTSHKRLGSWAERAKGSSHGRLQYAEVAGAGHFWREQGVMQRLLKEITRWDSTHEPNLNHSDRKSF